MSGAEPLAVLGGISSIITIAEKIVKVYDTVKSQQGIPEAFSVAADQLLIVRNICAQAQQQLKSRGDEHLAGDITNAINKCEENAKTLEAIFESVKPKDGVWKIERYYKAVKAYGKEGMVEKLLATILTNIQLVDSKLGLDQRQKITDAIEDLKQVPPSVPDSEFQEAGFTMNQWGSGTQHAQYTAKGNAYTSGGGKQFNAERQYFGKEND